MRIITCILVSVFVSNVLAQDLHKIDSLAKIERNRKGVEHFGILNDLAWEYRFVNQDSTIAYAKKAYTLGTKLGLKKSLGKPLNFIGVAYEYKGEAIEAYDYYKQALIVANAQHDQSEIAYANNNMGRLLFNQGNIARSSECYQTALRIFEQKKDSIGMAYVYLNLAQLYQHEKNFKKAEEHFMKVYSIRLKQTGQPNISSLLQLGMFYREFDQLTKSNKCFLKADSLCAVLKDEILRAEVSILLAQNRLQERNLQEANAYASKAYQYATNKSLTRHLAGANFIMGRVAFEGNDLQKAKSYFLSVVNNSKPFKDVQLKMDAHYYLGRIYSKEGLRQNELQSQNQYLLFRDSIKEEDLAKQIARLRFQFALEVEQRKKENELLKTLEARNNTIIKKQQLLNIIYAVALVIIIIIATVLYRNVKLKHRYSIEIEKINSNLESIVEERTRTIQEQNSLLREYAYFNAHQIRGPLARILGLISVLDLEYSKDSFGPYMEMLHKAGNDLDSAIKEVNTKLNTVED